MRMKTRASSSKSSPPRSSAGRKPGVKRARRPSAASSTENAYERICAAIMDHSLPPGTRLIETKLCEVLGLGRTRVRQVLQRLAGEGLVTLLPNKGALVTQPTVQEALDVFEARRLLEPGIVERFITRASNDDLQRLREHLERERVAFEKRDRRASIRLSGEFHLLLAEAAGNLTLLALLRELVSRSSLIIAMFQQPGAALCPPDEHNALASALERRSPEAPSLMLHHLDHVLADLKLEDPRDDSVDLRAVLSREFA
jgi:DNA-binding GntR family transcriptional regulator